ncbi:hypothetical protein D3C87_1438450 [compost metagenome]
MLIAQRGQGLAGLAEHTGGTDENIIQIQLARIAAIHGRIGAAADARRTRIEQEQADTGFVTIVTGCSRRYDNQPGAMPCDHHRFTPVETPASILGFGAGAHIVQLVMAGRLVHGHCQLQLPAGNRRQQFVALLITA